jgi:hypothetical protein
VVLCERWQARVSQAEATQDPDLIAPSTAGSCIIDLLLSHSSPQTYPSVASAHSVLNNAGSAGSEDRATSLVVMYCRTDSNPCDVLVRVLHRGHFPSSFLTSCVLVPALLGNCPSSSVAADTLTPTSDMPACGCYTKTVPGIRRRFLASSRSRLGLFRSRLCVW